MRGFYRKPVLLFNAGTKDEEICQIVLASGMECELLAVDDEDTPKLICGHRELARGQEIKKYMKEWEARIPFETWTSKNKKEDC